MTMSTRPHRAERDFGLLVGALVLAFGLWWMHRGKFPGVRPWFVAGGALLTIFGVLWPRALALPYRAWMGLAEVLSKVVTTLVLFLVFYFVVTPIGLFKRLRGWDPLGRRTAPADSYWVPYPERQHDPRHFEKMY